ncbi:MAG: hypothetical protein HWQ38_28085 [Nostoc sp. NMS7]|uniref:hypothetical protein n=1 Tax=Nostoc sp. NMS7 TaxID=2815391 RepID=UPI0025D6D40D|nr:hypothetical protein [Nostoc sp. NMS7]MBN3950122.1 hypothetical protein [Nostoc sp. NMS7]
MVGIKKISGQNRLPGSLFLSGASATLSKWLDGLQDMVVGDGESSVGAARRRHR